ncbi:MAG: hypothetical protein J5545_08980 [Bacteroidaceae bacterium]|nr:hypothetical protein [Bacteroidaceae bacterium]
MKDGYLIHDVCRPFCLLIGCPLFTEGQLSVKHRQMIFPINMCQLTGQRHIQRTPLVTLRQSLLWFQVTERFF